MRKASTAEWILALVMTPAHAAAATGDLLEVSAAQDSVWFWTAVVRVFTRSLAGNFLRRPGAIMAAAFPAFVMQFLLPLPFVLLFPFTSHPDLLVATALCLTILTQYVIGRGITVLSGANPAAVCCALGLLNCIVGACNVNIVSINLALWQLPVIAGVLLSHRRSRLAAA